VIVMWVLFILCRGGNTGVLGIIPRIRTGVQVCRTVRLGSSLGLL